MSGQLAHSDNTRDLSNNNWRTAGQILDDIFTICLWVFKLFRAYIHSSD